MHGTGRELESFDKILVPLTVSHIPFYQVRKNCGMLAAKFDVIHPL